MTGVSTSWQRWEELIAQKTRWASPWTSYRRTSWPRRPSAGTSSAGSRSQSYALINLSLLLPSSHFPEKKIRRALGDFFLGKWADMIERATVIVGRARGEGADQGSHACLDDLTAVATIFRENKPYRQKLIHLLSLTIVRAPAPTTGCRRRGADSAEPRSPRLSDLRNRRAQIPEFSRGSSGLPSAPGPRGRPGEAPELPVSELWPTLPRPPPPGHPVRT